MRSLRFALIGAALLGGSAVESCAKPVGGPRPGDVYEITLEKVTSQSASNGSAGSSEDRDRLVERVIPVRDDGEELEFDLPEDVTQQDRVRNWQFPVRVFRPGSGPMRLLNRAVLEGRVDPWLKSVGMTRADCGRWIFTWNAFHIDCDPQSVIAILQAYDLDVAELKEGATYADPKAKGSATLVRKGAGLVAEQAVDPDAVHLERAEADVVVAGLMGKPVTLDDALRTRSKEAVSGTISTTFEAGPDGSVSRRTTVTRLEIRSPNGIVEKDTANQTITRRLVLRGKR